MKKLAFILLCCLACTLELSAQKFAGMINRTTVYETYQPARITLTTGRVIMQKEANVFLKNARLLFKKGRLDMEANMAQIRAVEFADKSYVRLDTMLAVVTDTLGNNRVLCTTTIDLAAFTNREINDRIISNFEIGTEQVSMASLDMVALEDKEYPLVNNYYFEVNGKILEANERTITRHLNRSKRSRLEFYLQMPDFDWGNPEWQHKVLELFEKK